MASPGDGAEASPQGEGPDLGPADTLSRVERLEQERKQLLQRAETINAELKALKESGRKRPIGSNVRGNLHLKANVQVHEWKDGVRVKVPTLAFTIVKATNLDGIYLGNMHLPARCGAHVVKIEQFQPHNWVDFPGCKTVLHTGDRLYVLPQELDEIVPTVEDPNKSLVELMGRCFRPCGDLGDSKKVRIAEQSQRIRGFDDFVKLFHLDDPEAEPKCERFDCFKVRYGGPPALVGAPASRWSSPAPFPSTAPGVRALNMRYTFNISPVMVMWHYGDGQPQRYILPALGATLVSCGDHMAFLYPGGPGAQTHSQLDQHVFKTKVNFKRLQDFAWLDANLPLASDVAPGKGPANAEADAAAAADMDAPAGPSGVGMLCLEHPEESGGEEEDAEELPDPAVALPVQDFAEPQADSAGSGHRSPGRGGPSRERSRRGASRGWARGSGSSPRADDVQSARTAPQGNWSPAGAQGQGWSHAPSWGGAWTLIHAVQGPGAWPAPCAGGCGMAWPVPDAVFLVPAAVATPDGYMPAAVPVIPVDSSWRSPASSHERQ